MSDGFLLLIEPTHKIHTTPFDIIIFGIKIHQMKKATLSLLVLLSTCQLINSQTIADALRYSVDNTNGTARFNSLGGAFGALGGDVSSLSINPAGSAVFINNSGAVSLSSYNTNNTSSYFNTSVSSSDTDANINQAGAVFVFENYNAEESPWKKITLGINYNITNNLSNNLFIAGNGTTSIAQFFLEQAQGIALGDLQLRNGESTTDLYSFLGETQGTAAQNAFLGFQGFIFDPLSNDPSNTEYTSNVAGTVFDQEYTTFSEGNTGKYSFNIGTQYTSKLFFGVNLNSHIITYNEINQIDEINSNPESSVNAIFFENNLSVRGAGFSAQFGAIAKLTNSFRLGLTYDTPTWFYINEETTQFLQTQRTVNNETITENISPQTINIFQEYRLRTPGRVAASAAYVFGKSGFISFDYSYKDYSGILLGSSNDSSFSNQNQLINNVLQGASSFKVGGEYRIDALSLRGGVNYEESPYTDEVTIGNRTGFSFGAGYNFGVYNFDVSYSRTEQDNNQQLFNIGLTDTAAVESVFSSVIFTLGVSL